MPKTTEAEDGFDPVLFGKNVRNLRNLRNWSILYLADRSGVSHHTIVRVEQGLASTHRTRSKIAKALHTVPVRLAVSGVLHSPDVAVHAPADDEWLAIIDRRPRIPAQNAELIQSPDERVRLGRLKFVPQFVKVLKCRLPSGKLAAGMLEIHGDIVGSPYLNGEIFAYAIQGDSSLVREGEVIPMPYGSAVTFDASKPFFFRNENILPTDPPPIVLYVRLDETEDGRGKRIPTELE